MTDIAVPILNGELGTVRLGMSHNRIQQELARTTNIVILLSLSGLAAASVAVYVLATLLLTPISRLVDATERMRAGDLDQQVPVRFPMKSDASRRRSTAWRANMPPPAATWNNATATCKP